MSTTDTKRRHADALREAIEFRQMFPGCCERIEFAGSLRRQCAEVADVEIVAIPAFGEVAGDGLFGETKRTNLLWRRLDELTAARRKRRRSRGKRRSIGRRFSRSRRSIYGTDKH